jgi:hypothetical protein
VGWRTGTEFGLLGFNLYRQRAGRGLRLNPSLFSIHGGAAGARYRWGDRNWDRTSRYWLEIVLTTGSRVWHGPSAVVR